MCYWVTLLYSRKLTEHCKPAVKEKSKIIKHKKINQTKQTKKKTQTKPRQKGMSRICTDAEKEEEEVGSAEYKGKERGTWVTWRRYSD